MATYSKYTDTKYYAVGSTVLLDNPATQSYSFTENKVYTDLLDNTEKLIYPDRLRNAVLSLYDSIPFKETLAGSTYYVGLDDNSQNLKNKIYLGNRNYKGSEIVSDSMFNSGDIIINNTSTDNSAYLGSTVMAFLAGTNKTLHARAPRIDSRVVRNNDDTNRIDLSVINQTGDISLLSKGPGENDPGDKVIINNIGYPTVQSSGLSASDYKTFFYENGEMVWGETIPTYAGFYGASGTVVPISGSQTFVNDYSLDFTDNRFCPINLGGVVMGETYKNEPLVRMLESILYDYLPPVCTLEHLDQAMMYSEIGSYPDVVLKYSVTKRTLDTKPIGLKNMSPNQLPSIVSKNNQTVKGTAKGIVITPLEKTTTVFEIYAADGTSTVSASTSITGIYPIFVGLTSSATPNTNTVFNLNKIISEKKELKIDVFRSGISAQDRLYFIYDADYGPLTSIYNPNNVNVIDNFTVTTASISSPQGLWAGKLFRVYSLSGFYVSYVGPFTVSSFFRFVF